MAKFEFKGKSFDLSLVKEGNKLIRVNINDAGLEFPFPNYEKAADFLTDEYGGTKEEAIAVLNATESLEGLEVSGAVTTVNAKNEKKGSGKGKGKGKGKADSKKDGESDDKKSTETNKESDKVETKKPDPVKMTFNLPTGAVERTVQVKVILPDQKPLDTEDIKLSDTIGLHINRYSDKNRTTEVYKFKDGEGAPAVVLVSGKNGVNPHDVDIIQNYEEVKGEVLITGVSLMDAIYKYGEVAGMSFPQADKYIKICRGLLPKSEKKPKEVTKVTAEDLKSDKKAETKTEEVKTEEVKTEEVKTEEVKTDSVTAE
jgi:hypothetical protein